MAIFKAGVTFSKAHNFGPLHVRFLGCKMFKDCSPSLELDQKKYRILLLMEEILHQLIDSLSGWKYIPGGDRRISEPSTVPQWGRPWIFIQLYIIPLNHIYSKQKNSNRKPMPLILRTGTNCPTLLGTGFGLTLGDCTWRPEEKRLRSRHIRKTSVAMNVRSFHRYILFPFFGVLKDS